MRFPEVDDEDHEIDISEIDFIKRRDFSDVDAYNQQMQSAMEHPNGLDMAFGRRVSDLGDHHPHAAMLWRTWPHASAGSSVSGSSSRARPMRDARVCFRFHLLSLTHKDGNHTSVQFKEASRRDAWLRDRTESRARPTQGQ